MAHTMKVGNLLPVLGATLSVEGDPGFSLVGATVRFRMRRRGDPTNVIDAAATVDTGTMVATYTWVDGDTDAAGTFEAEFVATMSGGEVITFPTNGFLSVVITGGVAAA